MIRTIPFHSRVYRGLLRGLSRRISRWTTLALVCLAAGQAGCVHPARVPPAPAPGPGPTVSQDQLQRYKNAFYRAVGDSVQGPATRDELFHDARNADVLLLGDFHSDRQYHQRALTLLDHLANQVGPLLLIVEFLRWEDQGDLACYFAHEITLDELQRRALARHPRSWLHRDGLDSEGFLRFLSHARERGWIVHPVENIRQAPLPWRDLVIARRARGLMAEHRGYYPVVFYGQAHLLGHDRLEPRLGLEAVTVLPRPPRALTGRPSSHTGGLQRIRDRVYFLGPDNPTPDKPGPGNLANPDNPGPGNENPANAPDAPSRA